MASRTRRRVRSLTAGDPLSTLDTVPTPTPASVATSAMVARLIPSSLPASWKRFHHTTAVKPVVRILRCHGEPYVVAGRRALPGLPTLVRGLRQRRNRRSAGSSYTPRSSCVAGYRRDLAESDDALAERRLGLRRGGLLRRAPGSGDARGPRRPGRRCGRARDPRAPRSGPEPHQRPPRLVSGRPYRQDRC